MKLVFNLAKKVCPGPESDRVILLDINARCFAEVDNEQTRNGLSLNLSISTIQAVVSIVTVAAQLTIVYLLAHLCRQKIQLMRGHFTLLLFSVLIIDSCSSTIGYLS